MKRHELLTGVPIAALALSDMPVVATIVSPTADPHLAWLMEWRVIRAKRSDLIEAAGDETPETETLWDRRCVLDELIAVTPAVTKEGVAAKLTWVLEDCDGDLEHQWYGVAVRQCIAAMGGG